MNEPEQIREQVSRTYARAAEATTARSCCAAPPEHSTTQLAGYTAAELESLPSDAVAHSFGCGNPLAFGELREGDVVLDLGSGAGIDVLLAARRVGPSGRAIGIDMTPELLDKARRNIAAAGLNNAEVRAGLIEELPVSSASVDWVISNCVINLSPEKPKVFREIARVLKPGGRMLVSDIVAEELPAAVRRSPALYSSCLAGAISESAYLAGLRHAGLIDVEVRQRMVYEASQIGGFLLGALARDEKPSPCGGTCTGEPAADVAALAEALAGTVWSAQFSARKPTP